MRACLPILVRLEGCAFAASELALGLAIRIDRSRSRINSMQIADPLFSQRSYDARDMRGSTTTKNMRWTAQAFLFTI